MDTENETLYKFTRDGKNLGIRIELDSYYDNQWGTYSSEVLYILYRYNGDYYKKEPFDPSPNYVQINNGRGVENALTREEYQKKIRELYPDECEKSKELFIRRILK